ncbi:MAG: hypothetical protein ABWZ64_12900 [Xanthobacteraceae bacterium]|jgi:hypothetical protein
MFVPLLDAVRADIDRQIGWSKDQVRRQTRYTALIGALAAIAVLAVLGAIIIGLIALYFWLAMRMNPLAALGMIGGALLVVALILVAVAFVWGRPRLAPRPRLQIAQPVALFEALMQGGSGETSKPASRSSRPTLLGTLALAVVVGLIAGRRL